MRSATDAGPPGPRPPVPGWRRWALLAVGWSAIGLAVAGVALPLVPTTPFLLLAAACFVRSSPRLHRKMRAHPRLGPYLEQWERDRSIPRGAKLRAYLLVVLTFSISIAVVDRTGLRVFLALLGTGLLVFLARLRTAEATRDSNAAPDPTRPPGLPRDSSEP